MKKLLTLFILTLTFSTSVLANNSTEGWWIGTFSKKKITSTLSGWMETQVRSNFESGEVNQLLYRTGLLYKPSEESRYELGGLIAYIITNGSLERRLTFQHSYTYLKTSNSKLSHRARVEGRDFENTTNDSLRLRYLIRYNYKSKSLPLVLWNESFIHLTNESDRGHDQYERNRAFVGTRLPFGTTSLEFGYLNQTVFRKQENSMEHLAVLYWFF